jgi:hypothetical protein
MDKVEQAVEALIAAIEVARGPQPRVRKALAAVCERTVARAIASLATCMAARLGERAVDRPPRAPVSPPHTVPQMVHEHACLPPGWRSEYPSKTGQDRCNAEDFRGPCSAKWYDQLTIERLLKGRVTRPSWTLVCLEVAPRYGLRTRR